MNGVVSPPHERQTGSMFLSRPPLPQAVIMGPLHHLRRTCGAWGTNTKEHEALNISFAVSNKVSDSEILCLLLASIKQEQANSLACKQDEIPGLAQMSYMWIWLTVL